MRRAIGSTYRSRVRALALLALLMLHDPGTAEACSVHTPKALHGPSRKQLTRIEPARILVVETDLGRRFMKALEELGHEVQIARDAEELVRLTAAQRWDVAIVSAHRAKHLLENLSIAMVVPVADGPEQASDFEFVITTDSSRLKEQIEVLHHALSHRPVLAKK